MKKCLIATLCLTLVLMLALPAAAESTPDYAVGSYVTFGHYEQDNEPQNGKEPVEWLVLERQEDRVFLLSRYCLDARAYHTDFIPMTWELCALRSWMNGEFFTELFTPEEQARVLETEVVNRKNPHYSTPGGNDTLDRIYLLSLAETEAYFPSIPTRQASATAYAKAHGAFVNEKNGNSWWWLRSPGVRRIDACGVRADGRISGYGSRDVNRPSGTIRPVIWLSIEE